MPEIRHNVITREWVIIATERAKRPEEFAKSNVRRAPLQPHVPTCPFCVGNEDKTPPESYRTPVDGPWQVRAVPNKFAALDPTALLSRHVSGLKRTVSGVGIHEVIIETPHHDRVMALLSEAEMLHVLETFRHRYNAITSDPRVAHATLFKNHGERAGTSLEHPHSQIVGTPIIPPSVRDRMENALRYYDETGQCIYCSVLEEELRDQVRVVAQSRDFVAFIPYASLTPFHLWIFPLHHQATFSDVSNEQLADLSWLLRLILRKVYFSLSDPDYNISVRTSPREAQGLRYYHWYLSIIPRVTRRAGFELGSGMFINTAMPESSAAFLRNAPAEPVEELDAETRGGTVLHQ
ncbi:MAG TPA: galactose-1-phosphate uridylyltransferase [Candidatus Sulfotelmatobacter sp.]|nr:galactose-1-phosphate uridylyltransferase [Candidatus Sulfotelmatobacter sp.]